MGRTAGLSFIIKGESRTMSVRIIVDSTADLNPALRDRFTTIPLTIYFGQEEYIDGVTIQYQQFYEKLVQSDALPTTSQPTPAAFAAAYQAAVQAGDDVVVITISSKLSGTYQSASIAALDYQGKVYVVDSLNAAIGTGVLAELALGLADSGMSAKQIAERVTAERENICLVATLDTLEYLKKGGRISKTVAFAGELLSIKPVITLKDGVVVVAGKARGAKQGNTMLMKLVQEAGVDFSKPILFGYTGVDSTLLEKFMEDSAGLFAEAGERHATPLCSVIGTHVGPGAYAVAFFQKN